MRHHLLATAAVSFLLLAGCGSGNDDAAKQDGEVSVPTASAGADSMASDDPAPGKRADAGIPDAEARPVMQLQVVLERLGFGPGVIDGKIGLSTKNALSGFQEANGLAESGEADEATIAALAQWSNIPATRVVTIPEDWAKAAYRPIPESPADQAKLDAMGYESLDERLAERFHTTVEVLRMLNPGGRPAAKGQALPAPVASPAKPAEPDAVPVSYFSAGQSIRVPNIGADRIDPAQVENKGWLATLRSLGVGTAQPEVAKIVVDKSSGWLKGYDAQEKLVVMFTVTTGSHRDPLPIGNWGINGISYNPDFAYNPELFWDVPNSEDKQRLPPGPNGPVGVAWIDLTKEHYGIHGTTAPETIGRAESHGCVRLTNWDVARLAQMVSTRTKVVFQE